MASYPDQWRGHTVREAVCPPSPCPVPSPHSVLPIPAFISVWEDPALHQHLVAFLCSKVSTSLSTTVNIGEYETLEKALSCVKTTQSATLSFVDYSLRDASKSTHLSSQCLGGRVIVDWRAKLSQNKQQHRTKEMPLKKNYLMPSVSSHL